MDILIPTQDRAALLRRCLASLEKALNAVEGRISARLLVCMSGQCQEVASAASDLQSRFNCLLSWRFETKLSAAQARNRLLPHAAAEWLFFIDDDASVPEDFFETFLLALARHPSAAVIGGPNLTPAHSSVFQRASGAVLGSRFGASVSSARYAPRGRASACDEASLILCNLFVRRKSLGDLQFAEHLRCNEENWLLQDLQALSELLIYDPKLCVWHERRKQAGRFATQIYNYGIGRGQNLRERPSTAKSFHLFPAASVAFSAVAFLSWPWVPILGQLWIVLGVIYLALALTATARMWFRSRLPLTVAMLGTILFPLIHVCYGTGVLLGLLIGTRRWLPFAEAGLRGGLRPHYGASGANRKRYGS